MSVADGRPVVDIEGLSISYLRRKRPLRVIEDLTLSIRPGEAYGLVGESGCGKSTTGRAVLQLPRPTGGKVLFEGNDLLDSRHYRSSPGRAASRPTPRAARPWIAAQNARLRNREICSAAAPSVPRGEKM